MIRRDDRVVHVDDDDASLVGVVVKTDATLAHVVWGGDSDICVHNQNDLIKI